MLEIGQIYDDLLCVEKVHNDKYMNEYRMRCTICGREKNMIDHTVFRHSGTTHKACGKGLSCSHTRADQRHQHLLLPV